MAKRYERIGDVRGAGLYVGVELVKDRKTKEPDATAALAVVNGPRARRVLISATGAAANTLKIRPPLVFSEANVDRLLSETEAVLAALKIDVLGTPMAVDHPCRLPRRVTPVLRRQPQTA
ncbi:hypothetical protein [Bradyrhizobium sp. AZCC 2230]|uniref:hypothetical protein n=1 Tax=Bradyrhizobium sp. AZCC 2230 TaxID=3117021 RepID=UPI00303A9000